MDKSGALPVEAEIASLEALLELYRIDNGQFPTTDQGLGALVARPTIGPLPARYPESGYLSSGRLPSDPWGNPFQYRIPGRHNPTYFDLWSYGADGLPGGTCDNADVGNWAQEPPPFLECPAQHLAVQQLWLAAWVAAALAIPALVGLVLVRAVRAFRGQTGWRSLLAPPPVSFSAFLGAAFLLAFMQCPRV